MILSCFFTMPVSADSAIIATPSNPNILVNGKQVAFDAYCVNGYIYFKLRDIAFALNGTEKQFDVSWNSLAGTVELKSGKPYTVVGGELKPGSGTGIAQVEKTVTKIYVDGKEEPLTAYCIRGINYFRLNDLGSLFNFSVTCDNESQTIVIDTTKGYVVEEAYDGSADFGRKPAIPKVVSVTAGNSTDTIVIKFNKPMNEASVKKVFDQKLAILLQWYYSGDFGWGFLLGSLRYEPGSKLTIDDLVKMNSDKTEATVILNSSYWLNGKKREIIVDLSDCGDIVDAEGNRLQLDITDSKKRKSFYLVVLNPHLEGETISEINAYKEIRGIK